MAAVAFAAWRTQRRHPALVRLALAAAGLYLAQAIVGGLQVLTQLAGWTQTLHVALGAGVWALMCGLAVSAYYTARVTPVVGSGGGRGREPRSGRRR